MIKHQCDVCNAETAISETYGVVLYSSDQPPTPNALSYHTTANDKHNTSIALNVQVAAPRQLCGKCLGEVLAKLLEERYDATVQFPAVAVQDSRVRSLPPA